MKKVIIMGLGRGTAIAKAISGSKHAELAALVDTNPTRLDEATKIINIDKKQLFTDVDKAAIASKADILVVATPIRFHTEHVISGLTKGLHVLCEKPLAMDRISALAMHEAAQKANRKLGVIQNMRWLPQFRKCRELLQEGTIGALSHVEMNFHRWRPAKGLEHAVLFNHGVHHIDLIRSIIDDDPEYIHAVEWDPPWSNTEPGSGRFVRLCAMMRGGYAVSYNGSYAETGRQTPQTGELRIVGKNGSIEVGGEPDFNTILWLHRNKKATNADTEERVFVENCSWRDIDKTVVEDFIFAIEKGNPSETDISDNLKTLEWLFCAAESIKTGNHIGYGRNNEN